ncbi:TPA: hypothetical protein ACPZOS_002970, partial [Yersinia enterocolitica]
RHLNLNTQQLLKERCDLFIIKTYVHYFYVIPEKTLFTLSSLFGLINDAWSSLQIFLFLQ